MSAFSAAKGTALALKTALWTRLAAGVVRLSRALDLEGELAEFCAQRGGDIVRAVARWGALAVTSCGMAHVPEMLSPMPVMGEGGLGIALGGGFLAHVLMRRDHLAVVATVAGAFACVVVWPERAATLGLELLAGGAAGLALRRGEGQGLTPLRRALEPLALSLLAAGAAFPLSLFVHLAGGALWSVAAGLGTLAAAPVAFLFFYHEGTVDSGPLLAAGSSGAAELSPFEAVRAGTGGRGGELSVAVRAASLGMTASAVRSADGEASSRRDCGRGAGTAETDGREASYRILVVDDDAVNRLVASEILAAAGHQTEAVASGDAALIRLTQSPFDVVLMDFHMPGMNGAETIQCLRTLPDRHVASIGVAMLSADTSQDARRHALDAGADAFISKPFDTPNLLLTLQACIAARQEREGAGGVAPPAVAPAVVAGGEAPAAALIVAPVEVPPMLDQRLLANLLAVLGTVPLLRLLSLYYGSAERRIAALRQALSLAQVEVAQQEARTLKGAASVIGALVVTAQAQALEAACQSRSLGDAGEILERLAQANRQTLQAIDLFLGEHHLVLRPSVGLSPTFGQGETSPPEGTATEK